MRTHNYSIEELDFITNLAFYDIKKIELRRMAGENIGNMVWENLSDNYIVEFDLSEKENNYVWKRVSEKYEQDPELVDPRTRVQSIGLPFD